MDLQNTRMVNVQVHVGGDVPLENVTILPPRSGWNYTMHNSGGPPGAKTDVRYDAVNGSAF